MGPAKRGAPSGAYKRFAAGKTLAQGQFTCPEHQKSGVPIKSVILLGVSPADVAALMIWLEHQGEGKARS